MERQETSTYRIILTIRADYADTSYWTTDGDPSRGMDVTPLPFEKVKPAVADYLSRTLATIADVARTEPVEYTVFGVLSAFYPDGRQAMRHLLDTKVGSAEEVRNIASAWTDKNVKELALIGTGDISARTLPKEHKEKGKSSIVRLFTENRERTRS